MNTVNNESSIFIWFGAIKEKIMVEQEQRIRNAVIKLRPFIMNLLASPGLDADFTLSAKEEVLYRYQPIFLPENVDSITKEDFKSFLLFKNNRHWYGLHRQGGFITSDMVYCVRRSQS